MASEGSFCAYFRGNGANVLKIAPETALKLTLNDKLKQLVANDPNHIKPWERLVSGGVAGGFAQLLLYPLDTIRTRLAVSRKGDYRGIGNTFLRIQREEGTLALYRGIIPK